MKLYMQLGALVWIPTMPRLSLSVCFLFVSTCLSVSFQEGLDQILLYTSSFGPLLFGVGAECIH